MFFLKLVALWLRAFGITRRLNFQTDWSEEFGGESPRNPAQLQAQLFYPLGMLHTHIRKGRSQENAFFESRHITDVIVRPRPLVVARRLEHYGANFATLTFAMTSRPDPALGATEMFVPAKRQRPRSFRVEVGQWLTLAHDERSRCRRMRTGKTN